MNPAREYGATYTPNGREHDPTSMDFFLVFLSVGVTFVASGYVVFVIQKYAAKTIGRRLQEWRARSHQ